MQEQREKQIGVLCAASSYMLWGLIPIYFKQLEAVSPAEIIAHRVVWSVVLLVLLKLALPKSGKLRGALAQPKTLLLLAASAACIGTNWLVFVWAVNNGMILQTSLGYFINPLLSIAVGMLLLGETLRPAQKVAVGLAAFAVTVRIIQFGEAPLVALFLAGSFCAYGLLRKRIAVDPLTGLLIETGMMLPFALAFHIWLAGHGGLAFLKTTTDVQGLIILSGVVTTVPLALFAAGARRINLTTLGVLQYLSPSISFCVAVYYYREPFGMPQLWTFSLVWVALLVYTLDLFRGQHAARRQLRAARRLEEEARPCHDSV